MFQAHAMAPASPSPSAQAQEPYDPSGYWTALITQDWPFRMVVPGKGEYAGIAINLAAKQFADAYDPATYERTGRQCIAYGVGAIMMAPVHLHIQWADGDTLRVDIDAGSQTRLLRFVAAPRNTAPTARSAQGYSQAQWQLYNESNERFDLSATHPKARFGSIEVVTTAMTAGLIRKNGVPYSDQASLTEYWEVHNWPDERRYLTITSVLSDPVYLRVPYVTDPVFREEPGSVQWTPTACSLRSTP